MNDPYLPPKSTVADAITTVSVQSRSSLLLIGGWIIVFSFVVVAIVVPIILSQFITLFAGFGADLPRLTTFFIDSRFFWSVLPVLACALAIHITTRSTHTAKYRKQMGLTLIALLVGAVILFAFAITAMYLPIFQMGQVVGH